MKYWKLQQRAALLVLVLLLDAVLLGSIAGVIHSRVSGSAEAAADPSEPQMIALTFDDGPHNIYTEKLLDGLKERNVRATFFLMGENIEGNEDLVMRMQEEGHLIGNHSYTHNKMTNQKTEVVCEEIARTGELIKNIVGSTPQYLRPPYGDWNDDLECQLDLITVFWTVDSQDWKLKNKRKIVRQVVKNTEEDSIILMHDIFPYSVEAALEIVDTLQKKGYTFVTIDELLID